MADPPRHRWEVTPWLGLPEEVESLARRASDEDGHWPLSEQAVLDLRAGRAGGSLAVRGSSAELLGIAVVERQAGEGGRTVHLVVEPSSRRRGIARALLTQVQHDTAPSELALWAHGASPAAVAFAAALGLPERRRLHVLGMRAARDMRSEASVGRTAAWPRPALRGVVIRGFSRETGDLTALAALNRTVFAEHPDQGWLTEADLAERTTEPWFDPSGLLLAEQAGRLIGFHWTKVDSMPSLTTSAAQRRPGGQGLVGEVYVLGVEPSVRRRGLGRMLLEAGLDVLVDKGVDDVVVYVDADNVAAEALYRAAGFQPRSLDLAYVVPTARHGLAWRAPA